MKSKLLNKRLLSVFLLSTLAFTTACEGKKKTKPITYTYHEPVLATPGEWNPHILQAANNGLVGYLTTMGFVTPGMNANKDYVWLNEMADSITDITSSFSQKEKYGIKDTDVKRVYQIKLNREARWEDGTPINADSYIYSMKQLLDYSMKNPRSSIFTEGIAAIEKAKEYMYNGQNYYDALHMSGMEYTYEIKDGYVYIQNGPGVYYSVDAVIPAWGESMRANKAHNPQRFDDNGTDLFAILENQPKDDQGFTKLTPSLRDTLGIVASKSGATSDYWPLFCHKQIQYSATWDDVGFIKVDDYTLNYVAKTSITQKNLFSQLSSNFLVHEGLYEAGKKTIGGLTTTNYGTSVDTYKSYGPYKLVSIEADKQIVLAKNDQWYGYHDGKHQGMYQTTEIRYEVVANHNTQVQMFLKGDLEFIQLQADDMSSYKYSDHLLKADESFVFAICMNPNIDQLIALENQAGGNINKRVGAYKSFREAMSYAINRSNFVAEGTAGSKPQYGLFNNVYYYDIENDPNSIYRTSEQGMKVIVDHYGVEYGSGKPYATLKDAYNSITGYDLNKAKALFQQTYTQMVAEGNYTSGQKIQLDCIATEQSTISSEKMAQQNLLNAYLTEATKGTGFEGKIEIRFTASKTMFQDFKAGLAEMLISYKYGAQESPYYQIGKYVRGENGDPFADVPEIICYNPRNINLTLNINGQDETMTLRQWTNSINGGGGKYDNASNEVKLTILSAIEQYIIDEYIDVPLYSRCQVYLNSRKINQGNNEFNQYYQFGGIAYITYNYDDASWNDYVKKQGGTLSYE